jgi:hypothetical protein
MTWKLINHPFEPSAESAALRLAFALRQLTPRFGFGEPLGDLMTLGRLDALRCSARPFSTFAATFQ